MPLRILKLSYEAWEAGGLNKAYEALNERLRKAQHSVSLWGEAGGFANSDFAIDVLKQVAETGRPRMQICFTYSNLLEKLGSNIQGDEETIRTIIKEFRNPERVVPESLPYIMTAMERGFLKLFFARHDLFTPHFTIIDGKDIFLEQKHEHEEEKPTWFVRSPVFLVWIHKLEFVLMRRSALPLHNWLHLWEEVIQAR